MSEELVKRSHKKRSPLAEAAAGTLPPKMPGESDTEWMVRLYGPPPRNVGQWGHMSVGWGYYTHENVTAEFLDHCKVGQRDYSEVTGNRYKQIMADGQWRITGDAFCWSTAGSALNGQHRGNGVFAVKRDLAVAEIRGLDPNAIRVMDSGKRRTLNDQLRVVGIKRAGLSVAIQWAWRALHGRQAIADPTCAATTDLMMTLFDERRDRLMKAVEYTCYGEVGQRLQVRFGRGLPAALCAIVIPDVAPRVEAFFEVVGTGIGIQGLRDPAATLLDRVARAQKAEVASGVRERVTKQDVFLWIVRCWNAWARGEELSYIRGITAPSEFPAIYGFDDPLGAW